jgi:hypothetical protein
MFPSACAFSLHIQMCMFALVACAYVCLICAVVVHAMNDTHCLGRCLRALSSLALVDEELNGEHERLIEHIEAITVPPAAHNILWNLARAKR